MDPGSEVPGSKVDLDHVLVCLNQGCGVGAGVRVGVGVARSRGNQTVRLRLRNVCLNL